MGPRAERLGHPFAAGIKSAPQIQRGLDAITRARSTGAPTPRETQYIEAVARLYEHADSLPQRARLLSYRDAMTDLAEGQPADTEAAMFHALALVISADPADKTYASQLASGAILERLSAAMPDHPGIAHYIIHSYDVPPLAGRALGASRSGDTVAAQGVITALSGIRERLVQARESYWSEQVEIQRRAALAWFAFAAGRRGEVLAEMRAAAEREDATEKNAITPGPLAPARELLGEMLLAAHEPSQALAAFQVTLQHEPNRFRALAGAARSALAIGDRATADMYYAELLALGAKADRPRRAELVEAARELNPPK